MKRTRLNLNYKGDEMRTLLNKLAALGDHSTDHATIARALRVYEVILDERKAGNKIMISTIAGERELRLVL